MPKSPQPTRILVIDDEKEMLNNYRRMLERAGHQCAVATGPERLEALLADFRPDLVVTDLVMPTGSGMDVLERLERLDPRIPVVIITAHGTIESAVEAMKSHAADYLTKPFSIEELLGKIQALLSRRLIERASAGNGAAGNGGESANGWRGGIIGAGPAMERVLELARKVARTDVNVLVVGESGTGKEVIARAIHRLSARAREIFVPVDCASLPEALLESELFGYRKGAFTGAHADKMGLCEFAHKGTLFLDEIGEMPVALQAKLLRVLQERQFRPIGGREQIDTDVRVIAATNRDLEAAVRERSFRSDLYYRINVITLRLPPLRERVEDIPLLAAHFLDQFARENRLDVERISPAAMELMRRYDWPGNVRELQNAIEYSVTLSAGSTIEPADLPESLQALQPGAGEAAPVVTVGVSARAELGAQLFQAKHQMVDLFERDYLISLLVEHRFNISRAADAAGCHRRTLYRMIHRHRLDLDELRRQAPCRGKSHPGGFEAGC